MKVLTTKKSTGLLLCLLALGWFLQSCAAQDQEDYSLRATMEKEEQKALYSTIKAFVGDWWNGSDLYPDPCGWTPIQGVGCDLFNGYWYVTTISVGPVLDNSPKCNETAKFPRQLFELKHLKSLSFINCFTSPSQNPTKLPTSNWEALSSSLESLEFRSNPGLIGTVPLAIGLLEELQSLVFLENSLTGKLPRELGNLVNLKRLVLAGNRLSGEIPSALGGLSDLLILDSSRNSLSGSLPLTFRGLTSLLKLDLSSNKLEGKLPEEIGSLKNLTLLDLGGNNISGGLAWSLEEMVSLKELVISNNPRIGGNLMGVEWKNLQSLEILDLSNTGLEGTIPESVAEMRSLRFLGLNSNCLSGNITSRLETMPKLGALYLYSNHFTGKLEFKEDFYRKMGRRFGAWNNSNLCYRVEMVPGRLVPYGVKPCKEETTYHL